MEGSPSSRDESSGLTARVLPAIYLFIISVVAGVIIGHAATTLAYHPKALQWLDFLAVPIIFLGYIAFKGHLRALEEHTKEEYLKALRKGVSPYVITLIAVISLVSGLVTGGIYAMDNADRKLAENDAKELKLSQRVASTPPEQTTPTNSPALGATKSTSVTQTPNDQNSALQLQLKSIIVDSTRRTALINNIVLGEGQTSQIKAGGISYEVKCLQIESTQVLLEVIGQTNQLVLKL